MGLGTLFKTVAKKTADTAKTVTKKTVDTTKKVAKKTSDTAKSAANNPLVHSAMDQVLGGGSRFDKRPETATDKNIASTLSGFNNDARDSSDAISRGMPSTTNVGVMPTFSAPGESATRPSPISSSGGSELSANLIPIQNILSNIEFNQKRNFADEFKNEKESNWFLSEILSVVIKIADYVDPNRPKLKRDQPTSSMDANTVGSLVGFGGSTVAKSNRSRDADDETYDSRGLLQMGWDVLENAPIPNMPGPKTPPKIPTKLPPIENVATKSGKARKIAQATKALGSKALSTIMKVAGGVAKAAPAIAKAAPAIAKAAPAIAKNAAVLGRGAGLLSVGISAAGAVKGAMDSEAVAEELKNNSIMDNIMIGVLDPWTGGKAIGATTAEQVKLVSGIVSGDFKAGDYGRALFGFDQSTAGNDENKMENAAIEAIRKDPKDEKAKEFLRTRRGWKDTDIEKIKPILNEKKAIEDIQKNPNDEKAKLAEEWLKKHRGWKDKDFEKIKPVEVKKEEIKPVATTPVEVKKEEIKPVATTPVEVKKEEIKPVATTSVEVKKEEIKPVATTPVEVKKEEIKPVEIKINKTEQQKIEFPNRFDVNIIGQTNPIDVTPNKEAREVIDAINNLSKKQVDIKEEVKPVEKLKLENVENEPIPVIVKNNDGLIKKEEVKPVEKPKLENVEQKLISINKNNKLLEMGWSETGDMKNSIVNPTKTTPDVKNVVSSQFENMRLSMADQNKRAETKADDLIDEIGATRPTTPQPIVIQQPLSAVGPEPDDREQKRYNPFDRISSVISSMVKPKENRGVGVNSVASSKFDNGLKMMQQPKDNKSAKQSDFSNINNGMSDIASLLGMMNTTLAAISESINTNNELTKNIKMTTSPSTALDNQRAGNLIPSYRIENSIV